MVDNSYCCHVNESIVLSVQGLLTMIVAMFNCLNIILIFQTAALSFTMEFSRYVLALEFLSVRKQHTLFANTLIPITW